MIFVTTIIEHLRLSHRPNVKVDKMEKVIDKICEKLSSQQSESDWIFAELEEKRMKFEDEDATRQAERRE